ncbi:hypothetical protein GGX14DRAFT_442364 [Mycena pura]|uniref:Uncharacterized protein n=1 Tax=Mycena pura TaxID=153505 RepID=A0AAD6VPL0_9AGAR|nr:hypothetical protein GGX14DRAFT_442364 [Mycena pura]
MPGRRVNPSTQTPQRPIKVESSSDASAFTPASSVDVNGLPAFLAPIWESHILPKLYEALDRSRDPMGFGAYGESRFTADAAVATFQAILDDVCPGNTWKLKWGDPVAARVKCSADAVVAGYFATHGLNTLATIRSFVAYALRNNGPAFWRDPTPEACIVGPKSPGYIKPTGYLESELMVMTLSPFLKIVKIIMPDVANDGSFNANDLPTGLLGMAKAAVYRSLSLYAASGAVPLGQQPTFSADSAGGQILAAVTTIGRFTVTWTRWSSILTSSGAVLVEDGEDDSANPPAFSDPYGDDGYIPSSPAA